MRSGNERRQGSIPACAGEPGTACHSIPAEWVYPRVCGGTTNLVTPGQLMKGLSPRVRGNPGKAVSGMRVIRSIPACAGEPGAAVIVVLLCRVYPRVCGGTDGWPKFSHTRDGLSPRVRGNRRRPRAGAQAPGSIPACAGEPPMPTTSGMAARVYPRVCGGTGYQVAPVFSLGGLSPRVRGNREYGRDSFASRRSIPACAGEPIPPDHFLCKRQVYPRVCGGTDVAALRSLRNSGLSPRVRGNPR